MSSFKVDGHIKVLPILCPEPHCKSCKLKVCVHNKRLVKLLNNVIYTLPNGLIVIIKAGFIFDGASIPKWAWSIIGHPLSHKLIRFALLHDALYASEYLPRHICDSFGRDFLRDFEKLCYAKYQTIYKAVDWFGGVVWRNHDTKSVYQARKFVTVIATEQNN